MSDEFKRGVAFACALFMSGFGAKDVLEASDIKTREDILELDVSVHTVMNLAELLEEEKPW